MVTEFCSHLEIIPQIQSRRTSSPEVLPAITEKSDTQSAITEEEEGTEEES